MDIRILGLGNVLMGDDGFGPFVIEALKAGFEFASNVSVTDIGTPGLDLAPFLIGADAIIVADTVRAEGPAGGIRLYRRDEILRHAPGLRLGPHDPGFKQALLTLEFAELGPSQVLLVGAIPAMTVPTPFLTPAVRNAVPVAVYEILEELARLGAPARAKHGRIDVHPWWEQAA
jgi:hydrogenase maturation protease